MVERVDCFNQPNGPNGDQIVLVACVGIVFFDDMRDQPEIVFDQFVARVPVPILRRSRQLRSSSAVRAWERASAW